MTEAETREAIVREAIGWIGTPFVGRSALKGYGCDCAGLPLRVYQAVGLVPRDLELPFYSLGQLVDRRREDTTYLDLVLRLAKREVPEAEARPGDLVLWRLVHSWTHGGIIVKWPSYVIHSVEGRGAVGSHGTKEGFLLNRLRRFFTLIG